jgi:ribA/ribD-fused uncharacterized protein
VALFDDSAVFMFHARSKDAPPGEGVGEELHVPADTFAELARCKDWRRKLSNFAESPFELDGLRWLSVEHCFQGTKFREIDDGYYRSFSLSSGTALGTSVGGDVKRAGGRRGRPLGPAELARWDATKKGVMSRALFAKFSQHAESREILLATGLAKLTHRPLRARHTHVEMELMEVRAKLREEHASASDRNG